MVNSMRQVTVAETRAVPELVPRQSLCDLLPQLQALREVLPNQATSSADTVRVLRDRAEG
jgi:hypothetical protein